MNRALAVVLMLFLAALARAQSPNTTSQCALTVAQSPEIRGVRLGTSTSKLLTLFPETMNRMAIDAAVRDSKRADSYGYGNFELRPDNSSANEKFSGVEFISIQMLDERVTSFYVSYTGPYWNSLDQFIGKLSASLNLPAAENWKWEGGDSVKSLKCNGFSVVVHSSGGANNYVAVRDTAAPEIITSRRDAAREKARQAFKP